MTGSRCREEERKCCRSAGGGDEDEEEEEADVSEEAAVEIGCAYRHAISSRRSVAAKSDRQKLKRMTF